ncbi:MAG: hypothetical protein ABIO86_03040 [Sphingomonas sp.]
MNDAKMLTVIDGPMLAAAFPVQHQPAAMLAGLEAARLLAPQQWTERFAVRVESETVLIPARLRFASQRLALTESDEAWCFARALQTRSNDGFERQRATRDLLKDLRPWAAPFVVALIGEYIVEILEDISAAMTPEVERTVGGFITHNAAFWNTTKCRMTSYWNVYYRSNRSSECRRAWARDEYVGFELVDRLEAAAYGTSN